MSDYQSNAATGLTRSNYPDEPRPMINEGAVSPISPKMRSFTVQPLDHGYVVQVGCTSFAIESEAKLIEKLSAYIIDPADTEAKWNNKTLFS